MPFRATIRRHVGSGRVVVGGASRASASVAVSTAVPVAPLMSSYPGGAAPTPPSAKATADRMVVAGSAPAWSWRVASLTTACT